jgi:menaquinol-cytochrome c reductase iron-sulfur subunit
MTHESETNKAVEGCAQCAAKNPTVVTRRSFFSTLLGIGSSSMGAILGVPIFRFALYPAYAKEAGKQWSDVGDAHEFADAKGPVSKMVSFSLRDGWREVVTMQSVYVNRKPDGELQVLSAICPHMGCSVGWQASQGKLVCPCHGGQFTPDGKHIAGPPPRGMDNLRTQVKDAKLQVQFEYFRSNLPNQEKLS